MADTTAPILTGLSFTERFDLREGDRFQTYLANAEDDASGIDKIVIWFDRSFTDNIGDFNLVIPSQRVSTDSWTATRTLSQFNSPGTYSVTKVVLDDKAGNSRTYTSDQLKGLGYSTAFECITDSYDPTYGDDILSGSNRIDALYGYAGNDKITGLDKNDTLFGGDGNDTLFGGNDNDVLVGGHGDDILDGGTGFNTARFAGPRSAYKVSHAPDGTYITSGEGKDKLINIQSFEFSDWNGNTLNSSPYFIGISQLNIAEDTPINSVVARLSSLDADGDEVRFSILWDTSGTFRIEGDKVVLSKSLDFETQPSIRKLTLQASDDFGGSFTDSFSFVILDVREALPAVVDVGTAARDILIGSDGSDLLTGGLGADRLYGGDGADAFIFRTAKESSFKGKAWDTIFDFSRAEGDRIDLKAIDADAKHNGNQAFSFIGSKGFRKHAGELRYEKAKGGGVMVYGDTNGDGAADFAIAMKGVAKLLKGDFVL